MTSMLRSRGGVAPVSSAPSRSLTALAVALVLTASGGSAAARSKGEPEAELQRSQTFVAEGDEALARKDYEEAIAKYSAAYYELGTDDRASYMGSIPVRKAMRAYELLVAQAQDRSVLDRQLHLVTEFLEIVESRPDGEERVGAAIVQDLEMVRDAIERKIAALAEASAPTTDEPETEPEPERQPIVAPPKAIDPPPAPQPPPPNDEPSLSRRGKLGLGLTVSGGVILGIGAGLLAGWWTVRSQAIEFADEEPGYEAGTPERETYLAREEGRASRYLIAGASVMGVGVAVATAGAVFFAIDRRRGKKDVTLVVTPQLDLRRAGLAIGGHF